MREAYDLTAQPGTLRAVDWKKLVAEDRIFADSKDSLGLQLADIAATSLRRAFNGNLKKAGWESFGRLLIAKKKVPFFMLDTSGARGADLEGTALAVWNSIYTHAKPMIVQQSVDRAPRPDRTRRLQNDES